MSNVVTPKHINQAISAYLKLERMLVMLELTPGEVYSESDLLEKACMGRTPVREAIQRLEADGLLLVKPRAGIMIAKIKPEDFLKVLELRKVLEPILAEVATRLATAEQRGKISMCHDMMIESVKVRNLKLYLDADKMFDRLLIEAAKNPYLEKTLGPLQTHTRRFWFHFIGSKELESTAALHIPVMEAFKEENPKKAQETMLFLVEQMIEKAKLVADV